MLFKKNLLKGYPKTTPNALRPQRKIYTTTITYLTTPHRIPVTLLCLALLLFFTTNTMAMKAFRIGTAGSTGVYYPIGKLIATGLTLSAQKENSALKGHIGVAQNSAGSIENVQNIVSGDIEAGLVQADIAAFAYNKDVMLSLRAIASLYSEKFQIVVRKDADIQSFLDLKGKRISVDELGSGTLSVMRIILEAHKMTENDLIPLYLKPSFTHEKLKNGLLHGFVMMAGAPMASATQLRQTGITLVPIDPLVAADVNRNYPYLFPGKIDADVYSGVAETSTLEVSALLIVDETMSDEIAYTITETLFNTETVQLFKTNHPQGQSITLDTALNGISIPLHPGAERYYRERKLLD